MIALVAFAWLAVDDCGAVRVVTFNIETYPRSDRQERGAFGLLAALEPQIVAVQEIVEPERFAHAARHLLGEGYRFVHTDTPQRLELGVLYDSTRFDLLRARTHEQTVIDGRGRPAFEVRLEPRDGGRPITLVVLHLKAGGEGHEERREQLRRLSPVVHALVATDDELVVLGDFNATGDRDRDLIAHFAHHHGLFWASEELACTAYWSRDDGCRGSRLDHVLTRWPPQDVTSRGPCETEGCEPGERCPAFHSEVSDHCPVSVDL